MGNGTQSAERRKLCSLSSEVVIYAPRLASFLTVIIIIIGALTVSGGSVQPAGGGEEEEEVQSRPEPRRHGRTSNIHREEAGTAAAPLPALHFWEPAPAAAAAAEGEEEKEAARQSESEAWGEGEIKRKQTTGGAVLQNMHLNTFA